MNDYLHNVLKWVDYNRWKVISLVVFVALFSGVLTSVGCESTTTGLFGDEKVNRPTFSQHIATMDKDVAVQRIQLDAAVAEHNEIVIAMNKDIEAGLADLDKQDEFRQEIISTIGIVATSAAGGTLNPTAMIPIGVGLLGGLFGLGAAGDKRRADARITELENKT